MKELTVKDLPDTICVLGLDGRPRMPMYRKRRAIHLLKVGKARIAEHVPFTIQLLYQDTCILQPLLLGIDPGRTNIGATVITEHGDVVYTAEVHTRNKEIVKLMDKRRMNRRTSRLGRRKVRQRLAKRCSTVLKDGEMKRHLPSYGEDKSVTCHTIRNTEARFCNRKRPKGWLTPSAEQLVRTHINLVHKLQRYMPISDVCLEVNRFAFASMEYPAMEGIDFQNGPLKGFDDVNDAVWHRQKGNCLLCNRGIDHYHHVVPRYQSGSNTMPNIAGLCSDCHDKVHKDGKVKIQLATKMKGINKKYGALSVLNQSIPYIYQRLHLEFGEHLYATFGNITYKTRNTLQFEKTADNQMHYIDAYCIALHGMTQKKGLKLTDVLPDIQITEQDFQLHTIQQFRRHNRARIKAQYERVYQQCITKNGKEKWVTVAKNRNPRTEQKELSLTDWFQEQCRVIGKKEARKQLSKLRVVKSYRSYNDKKRILPGAVFLYQGQRYVLGGQKNNGSYYYPYGADPNKIHFSSKKCKMIKQIGGLVFLD